MPITHCTKNNKPGYKWGEQGSCYTYISGDKESQKIAKDKVKKQAAAIEINKTKNMVNNFKYIQNYVEGSTEATIFLYDTIGAYYDPETEKVICTINGKDFAKEMEFLQDKVSCIHIKINSGGGNVLDGYAIIDSIRNSKIPVYTYNVGIAASIASLIFLAGHKRFINDYAVLMIHNPSMGDAENSKLLNVVKQQLITFLANNCIYSEKELSGLMDEETYLDAIQCETAKLVDEVLTTDREIPKIDKNNVIEMAKIYNTIIKNEKDMKKVKNTADETDKDATTKSETVEVKSKVKAKIKAKDENLEEIKKESEVEEEKAESTEEEKVEKEVGSEPENEMIQEEETVDNEDESEVMDDDIMYDNLEEANDAIKSISKELKETKAKLAEHEAKIEEERIAKVDNMLNHYITNGSIKNTELDNMKKLALIDFDSVNNMLSKINIVIAKPAIKKESVNIFNNTVKANPSPINGRETWNIRDWEKKDPNGLAKLKNETPELYNNMFNAFYIK